MAAFATSIFASAFLLFQVQPIVARHILPWLGGGPAVWTVCMLFFQLGLLLGYSYAYFLARHMPLRRQTVTHLGALVVSLAVHRSRRRRTGLPPTARIRRCPFWCC